MSLKITVYQKPTCTTCKNVYKALQESGVDFEAVDYYTEPLSREKLTGLVQKLGIPARDLFRKKADVYEQLKLAEKQLTDQQAVDLLVTYPDLLQRPIVETEERAILARPADRLKEILPQPVDESSEPMS